MGPGRDRRRRHDRPRPDPRIRIARHHLPVVVEARVVRVAETVEDARLPRDPDPGPPGVDRGDVAAMHAVRVHQDELVGLRAPGRSGLRVDHPAELGVDIVEVRVDLVERERPREEHRRQRVREQVGVVDRVLGRPARTLEAVDVVGVLAMPRSRLHQSLLEGEVGVVAVVTGVDCPLRVSNVLQDRAQALKLARETELRVRELDRHVEDVLSVLGERLDVGRALASPNLAERHRPTAFRVEPHVEGRVEITENGLAPGVTHDRRHIIRPNDDRILRREERHEQTMLAVTDHLGLAGVLRRDRLRSVLVREAVVVVLHDEISL